MSKLFAHLVSDWVHTYIVERLTAIHGSELTFLKALFYQKPFWALLMLKVLEVTRKFLLHITKGNFES